MIDNKILNKRIEDLKNKLEALKPILKQIELSTNTRPPLSKLSYLVLNEKWFCVWDILECSEFKENKDK